MTKDEIKKIDESWITSIKKNLLNKKIVGVRMMSEDEVKEHGWTYRAIVLILNDGEMIYPSMDDEGNDAGAIFTTYKDLQTIPVMR